MSEPELEVLKAIITDHEGLRLFPYLDCCGKAWRQCVCRTKGKLTIGIGRNLDDVGITHMEADMLLDNSIANALTLCEREFPWFRKLNSARKMVIASMVFNMGIQGVKQFIKMIKCIESGDFESAAAQMLNSKWSAQVGKRAVILSNFMRTGMIS